MNLLQRRRTAGRAQQAEADAPVTPGASLVEFAAYAPDCRIVAAIATPPGRLSDFLNHVDSYDLLNVQLQELPGGALTEMPELTVARDELVAVHGGDWTGLAAQRRHTRSYRLLLRSDLFAIWGYVHVLPGSDPIASFKHRRPMVALTDASIAYTLDGAPVRRAVDTLIVNRELADSVAVAPPER